MKNLLAGATRRAIERRIASLDASARPLWGRMNATEMLAHCSAQLQMSLGEIECRPKKSALSRPPLKQLIVYLAPWPKSAPTAPELIRPDTETWSAEKARLVDLIERFVTGIAGHSAPHPLFGKLTTRAWSRLAYRHLDHHLRQFGV